MSDQDYENTIGRLDDRIAELEAEVERLRMNLDAYKQAEELWCRQDEKREAENKRLREALETIAKEEDTLGWVYAARIAKAALEAKPEKAKSALIKFMAYVARECIAIDDVDEACANRIRNQIYETKKVLGNTNAKI